MSNEEQSIEASARIVSGGESLDIYDVMQRFRNDGSCEHVIEEALRRFANTRTPVPTGGVEAATPESNSDLVAEARELLGKASRTHALNDADPSADQDVSWIVSAMADEIERLNEYISTLQFNCTAMENFLRTMKETLNLHGPTPDMLGEVRRLRTKEALLDEIMDCDKRDLCEERHG